MVNIYNYIGKTFFIMALSMLCSFICTIILAKKMSFDSFGLFALVKSMIPLLSIISLAGFEKAYTKRYATRDTEGVIHYLLLFIIVVSFLVSFLFTYIYSINEYLIYIYIGTVFGALNLFLTSYFRLKDYYFLAQFISSGHKVIFFVFILVGLNFSNIVSESLSVKLLSFAMFVPSILYIFYYFISKPKYKSIRNFYDFFELYRTGFIFFIIGILNLILMTIDKWIIPILYDNQVLGIYTALGFVCITVYSMLGSAIGYVIFPELSKRNNLNVNKFIKSISIIPIVVSLFFLFFGEIINDLVYEGKYNPWQSFEINIYFIVIGLCQFFNAIIHWIVLSKGLRKTMFHYFKIMLVQILLIFIGSAFFLKNVDLDINMIAFFIMILIMVKLISTYFLVKKIIFVK
ncbi:MAG: hypothetical protein CMG00_01445 [Candidatus Marinimicrobia bacterium]|nr:hypothetical protein [Candidatus Neomarinimicrobiota bacterium]|tara:strand:- start:4438 stop:5646 length:1209 start_codon:yes stop_codon:yes gene_type:complete